MRRLPAQTLIEWIFVACLIVVCALLSGFQYHWSGEVSRVTAEHLRSGLAGQAQLPGSTFDSELFDACNQLLPDSESLTAANREAVHAAHLRRWQSSQPRPVFRRLAVVVSEAAAVQLYVLDQKTAGSSPPARCPPRWSRSRRRSRRRPPRRLPPCSWNWSPR